MTKTSVNVIKTFEEFNKISLHRLRIINNSINLIFAPLPVVKDGNVMDCDQGLRDVHSAFMDLIVLYSADNYKFAAQIDVQNHISIIEYLATIYGSTSQQPRTGFSKSELEESLLYLPVFGEYFCNYLTQLCKLSPSLQKVLSASIYKFVRSCFLHPHCRRVAYQFLIEFGSVLSTTCGTELEEQLFVAVLEDLREDTAARHAQAVQGFMVIVKYCQISYEHMVLFQFMVDRIFTVDSSLATKLNSEAVAQIAVNMINKTRLPVTYQNWFTQLFQSLMLKFNNCNDLCGEGLLNLRQQVRVNRSQSKISASGQDSSALHHVRSKIMQYLEDKNIAKLRQQKDASVQTDGEAGEAFTGKRDAPVESALPATKKFAIDNHVNQMSVQPVQISSATNISLNDADKLVDNQDEDEFDIEGIEIVDAGPDE
ncbi:hypothetical protein MP228_006264 [Amoeboaphelidium protococcarum]|nr:hypothetical protein MP228_006264 [Amoeboaphelidium protococcarum]